MSRFIEKHRIYVKMYFFDVSKHKHLNLDINKQGSMFKNLSMSKNMFKLNFEFTFKIHQVVNLFG